ncbi:Bestrophin [Dictyocaulus viviparus]|uniref:Bestrophin homolog n=1 Tax=Dictyocaulus viviparus TaxID=29172 RepID=A0A0D8XGV2_DICVI|nr:Bestrophin [Dictyocaulus viviparus]
MTVSYSLDLSSTSIIAFLRLQFRWRGSIWKSVLKVNMLETIYRSNHFLSEEQRKFWDDFSALFDQKLDYIPLTFMLGFFVTIIVGRWNDIFNNIGWVDSSALLVATYLRGNDEKSRMIRRNVVRYMVLTQVLIFRDISMQVRRRFPTLDTVVAAGLMTESEREKYSSLNIKYTKYFLPIQWCYTLLYEARVSGKLSGDLMLNEIIKVSSIKCFFVVNKLFMQHFVLSSFCSMMNDEWRTKKVLRRFNKGTFSTTTVTFQNVSEFRRGLAKLCNFDWVPIPLVYPQVVFLAVRSYFFLCLVARQSILIHGEPPKDNNPVYLLVPLLMTALQFIFYVGWMKVAESLMNPLGEDDDDFECNFLIDRNLGIGLSIVDECYNELPLQQKDIFWSTDAVEPLYSADTALKPIHPQVGSASHYEPRDDEVIMMPHIAPDDAETMSIDDAEARLLPRGKSTVTLRLRYVSYRIPIVSQIIGISVVSVNRHCGSRSSLASRKGIIENIRKQFSRDSKKTPRPNHLAFSQMSLNNDMKPTFDIGESSLDILGDLIDDGRNSTITTDADLSPTTPIRRSPVPEALTSVPEEDEDNQRTRNSVDLQKWKKESSTCTR